MHGRVKRLSLADDEKGVNAVVGERLVLDLPHCFSLQKTGLATERCCSAAKLL